MLGPNGLSGSRTLGGAYLTLSLSLSPYSIYLPFSYSLSLFSVSLALYLSLSVPLAITNLSVRPDLQFLSICSFMTQPKQMTSDRNTAWLVYFADCARIESERVQEREHRHP